ncbi:hypothetical protein CFIMG_003430RA [Ceratocystis fimbriata CBS 114723]|uniref:Reticulon-like protein n=2 Tax=Ceratocystis TaxID=5157 RepID=A0A0F8CUN7_CERFI|nr:Reticulon-like protein 1 [Ceratocystis platani]PHH50671.1 hypothetical protein CFIMG_003430RA [Ceratocystis fimbriata CBS 114723]
MADAKIAPKPAGENFSSYFQYLLSWNNPRDSGIAYGSIVASIILIRCIDVLRYAFKLTYLTLAVTVAAEVLGKLVIGNGLTSQMRPRKYWTISRDATEAMASDLHELANFISTESQKVIYVENTYVSGAALVGAFLSYHLVKIIPYWALAIMTVSAVFFGPLVYRENQEVIDAQIDKLYELVAEKNTELRKTAVDLTGQAGDMAKQHFGNFSTKAQSMLRGRVEKIKIDDFPAAPTGELKKEAEKEEVKVPEAEPLLA